MSLETTPTRRGSATKGPRRSILILPKMEHNLEDWLNFPTEPTRYAFLNSATLPFKWLLWTSKGLASLSPNEDMRTRLSSQSSLLGNVAALYLVVAISAFLSPPVSNLDDDQVLISIYGVLMFFSAICLTFFICLSMTVMYPLLESMPDFAATEAYENLAKRWGGYEMFLFNAGCQAVLFALLIAAKVIYSNRVVYCMVGLFCFLYCVGATMTREFFIAIDPITSLHMGICHCQETIERAKRLSEVIRKRLHDYLSKNEDNRKDYRDAHYSEMEPMEDPSLLPMIVSDSGSVTPVNSHPNDSVRSTGVTFTFPASEPATDVVPGRKESVASVESEMHISTKRPGFGDTGGTGTNGQVKRELDEVSDEVDDVTVPTLEEIFTGARPLLLYGVRHDEDSIVSFGVGRRDVERSLLMSLDDCESVLQVLNKQGCTTTESFIMLLKWHTFNTCNLRSNANGGVGMCSYGKVDLNQCVSVCVQLGLPMFHATLVIDYLKPYL